MTTPYIDLLQTVNSHLYIQESPPTTVVIDTTQRGKLNVIPEIQNRLQSTFLWKSCMFEDTHDLHFPRPIVCVSGRGSSVLDVNYHWSTEYFHFITEVLPNVLFLNKYYPNSAIVCGASSFTIPLLRWFGIGSNVISSVPPQTLRVQAPFVECGNPSPFKLDLLRQTIKEKMSFEKTHGILIHREKSRRLLNESDVLVYLQRKFPHLKWVVFDSISVDDTATLFSKAAVIAGPHGAGFTNMIFSCEGTQIIEFMPTEYPNVCYWHMAQMLKNPYIMVPCHIQNGLWDMIATLTNTEVENLF